MLVLQFACPVEESLQGKALTSLLDTQDKPACSSIFAFFFGNYHFWLPQNGCVHHEAPLSIEYDQTSALLKQDERIASASIFYLFHKEKLFLLVLTVFSKAF